jgi:hypothetical protein
MEYKVLRRHTRGGKFYDRDAIRDDATGDLTPEEAGRMVEGGILEPIEAKAPAKGKGKAAEEKAPE